VRLAVFAVLVAALPVLTASDTLELAGRYLQAVFPLLGQTEREMIERAVYDAAPDVTALEVDGLTPAAADGLVQLGLRLPEGGGGRPSVNQTVGSEF